MRFLTMEEVGIFVFCSNPSPWGLNLQHDLPFFCINEVHVMQDKSIKIKSSVYDITPKRVTSGEVHLRGLASG